MKTMDRESKGGEMVISKKTKKQVKYE